MINLNEAFELPKTIQKAQLNDWGLTSGVQTYLGNGMMFFDLLHKRKARIYYDGSKFHVNDEYTIVSGSAPKGVAYGLMIGSVFYYNELPTNEILNTIETT